jgi:hypothetical protein
MIIYWSFDMPNIVVELPETYSSITRPAITQVAKQLIEIMRLPPDTGFEFFGMAESQFQPQTTLTDTGIQNKFPFNGRINIEADEQYIEDRTLTSAVKKDNVQFVFYDQRLDVFVKPVYVSCEVTISFRYRAQDRTQAEKWRDEFRVRSSQGRAELLHEIDYHYPIPDSIALILHQIFTMRETVAGYGETLEQWVQEHISGRATTLRTQAGTQPLLAIAERQASIVGGFNFVAQPEKGQKAAEGAPWETGFDYTFMYDKVVAVMAHYPVVIHNQMVDEKFRPNVPVYELVKRARRPSNERFLYDYYTRLYKERLQPLARNRIPSFDDWMPNWLVPRTSPVLELLLGVDENDPHDLVNLNNLGDFAFSAAALRFLIKEAPFISKYTQSVFNFQLYRWDKPMPDETVLMDAALNVRSSYELTLRDVQHLRLCLVTDLSILTREALDRIRKDPEFAIELIKTLYPRVDTSKIPIIGGVLIPKDWFWDMINKGKRDQTRRMFTVGATGIIARRDK